MIDIIKQKIKNGEGKLKLKYHGIVDAKVFDEKNHPNWSKETKDEFQAKLAILKDKNLNPKDYKIELQKLNEWLQTNGVAQNPDWKDWSIDEIIYAPSVNDYELKLKKGKSENSKNTEDYDLIFIGK